MCAILDVKCPEVLLPAWVSKKPYIVFRGGRGSAKSWTFAEMAILRGMENRHFVLCVREIQNSIEDSVYKLLCDTIERLGLTWFYHIQRASITGLNGTRFVFHGLYRNITSVKSLEGVSICWVEEAQSISKQSWEFLDNTIRTAGSQIWISMNPENEEDAVYADLCKGDRDDVLDIVCNYYDNPWFGEPLKSKMERMKRNDYDRYLHVWEGKCIQHSDAQVYGKKWRVSAEPLRPAPDTIFYYGVDFGFSTSAASGIKLYIEDNTLYIYRELYGHGIENDDIVAFYSRLEGLKESRSKADNARPETISHLYRHGFTGMVGARKPPVEDGIAFIRLFDEIVVDPSCVNAKYELQTYKYRVDARTGKVSNVLIKENDHLMDAMRYALEDVMFASTDFEAEWVAM